VGVSRIHLTIDRLVLNGLDAADSKALVDTLQAHLSQMLADRSSRTQWARSHRTPMLKLGRMPLEAGPSGARKFGTQMARAVGKGLKP
jgi:hypothetical protein